MAPHGNAWHGTLFILPQSTGDIPIQHSREPPSHRLPRGSSIPPPTLYSLHSFYRSPPPGTYRSHTRGSHHPTASPGAHPTTPPLLPPFILPQFTGDIWIPHSREPPSHRLPRGSSIQPPTLYSLFSFYRSPPPGTYRSHTRGSHHPTVSPGAHPSHHQPSTPSIRSEEHTSELQSPQ